MLCTKDPKQRNLDNTTPLEPLTVCDRPTNVGALSKISLLPEFTCPGRSQDSSSITSIGSLTGSGALLSIPNGINPDGSTDKKSMLLLSGNNTFGRTGNNLIEFLHALQVARDQDLILGIMHGSWAMQVLMGMFMAIEDEDGWEEKWEDVFCGE